MSPLTSTDHIALLRDRAREAGIERFRMLRREDLVEKLRERDVEVAEGEAGEPKSVGAAAPKRKPAAAKGREQQDRRQREEQPTRPAAGVLDVTPRGHGFLRSGLQAADDDVYVSASQIRRCVLRAGDLVTGPAREPRRDERYPALVHVDEVNGGEPVEERSSFDDLTPTRPSRPLDLDLGTLEPGARDLLEAQPALSGLVAGQRILIRAEAGGSDRFALLRALATAVSSRIGSDAIVLLIDVPPEDLSEWQRDSGEATVAALAADSSPAAAGRVARLALEHAKRRAEAGADAVLIIDSLSRLAVFEDDVAGVKRLFGAGRQLEEDGAGSLTVIATTLGEDDAYKVVATTESALVEL